LLISDLVKGYLTTIQLAERLNLSDGRIRRMILDGLIKAQKVGGHHFISEKEARRFEQTERRPGRPASGEKR